MAYVYDKAEYHYETVTTWGLDSVQAEVHTAFFLGWLIDNDLIVGELRNHPNANQQPFPAVATRQSCRATTAVSW